MCINQKNSKDIYRIKRISGKKRREKMAKNKKREKMAGKKGGKRRTWCLSIISKSFDVNCDVINRPDLPSDVMKNFF